MGGRCGLLLPQSTWHSLNRVYLTGTTADLLIARRPVRSGGSQRFSAIAMSARPTWRTLGEALPKNRPPLDGKIAFMAVIFGWEFESGAHKMVRVASRDAE